MKLTATILASFLGVSAAFSPSIYPKAVRPSMARAMDPEDQYKEVVQDLDAMSVVLLDCDEEECHMVDGELGSDGEWHFHDHNGGDLHARAEGSSEKHDVSLLMAEVDDSE